MKRDFGDFQTRPALVHAILKTLGPIGERWPRVLEPTCGSGNFIAGLLALDKRPREIQALEKQESYVRDAKKLAPRDSDVRICVRTGDIFQLDLRTDLHWNTSGPLLVLGNPPWVTNADLGVMQSSNLPRKTNLKHFRGIDALTGQSNFDLAEHVWIKILVELAAEQPTIAMLCKTTVAQNVLRFAHEHAIPLTGACMHKIDARKWFHAAVEACLLTVCIGSSRKRVAIDVYPDLASKSPSCHATMQRGSLIWDRERYDRSSVIDGTCPMPWRQGIKHDAAKVMELTDSGGILRNRLGEAVLIEWDFVYPLLKGSDLHNKREPTPRWYVIVTQTHLSESTDELQTKAPKLWAYLMSHQDCFARRKSSVYAGRSLFCMFGVGAYAFTDYKVAIAGFYRTPRFRALGTRHGRPVMLDDTCYFLHCHSADQAALVTSLLNDPLCQDFLASIMLSAAKRPVTKRILQRIDLSMLLDNAYSPSLLSRYRQERKCLTGFDGLETDDTRDALKRLLLHP